MKRTARNRIAPAQRMNRATIVWFVGLCLAAYGVPLSMWITARNAYGPAKSVVLVLAAALLAIGFAMDGEALRALSRLTRSKIAIAGAGIVAVVIASAVVSVDVRTSILGSYPDYRGTLTFITFTLAGVGAAMVPGCEWRERLFRRGAVASVAVVSAMGLAQEFGVMPGGQLQGDFVRVASTLGNASNVGVFLVLALPLVVLDAAQSRSVARWVSTGVAVAGAATLAFTYSRGAWVALAVVACAGVGVAVLRTHGRMRLRIAGAATVAVVVLATGVYVLAPSMFSRALSITQTGARSASMRLMMWESAIDMTAARPLLGWGPGTFAEAMPPYRVPGQADGSFGYQVTEAAHNVFLDVASTSGVFALLGFVIITVLAMRELLRRRGGDAGRLALAAAASIGGGLVALSFHYVTMDTGSLLFAGFGLAAGFEVRDIAPGEAGMTPWLRGALLAIAAIFVACSVGAIGGLRADVAAAEAMGRSAAGQRFDQFKPALERARAAAPWEPAYLRTPAFATLPAASKRYEPESLAYAQEALLAYEDAVPLDTTVIAQHAELLIVDSRRSGDAAKLDEAQALVERAMHLDPKNGIPYGMYARIMMYRGDKRRALEYVDRAIALSPKHAQSVALAADLHRQAGDLARAEELRKRAEFLASQRALRDR